MSDVTKYDDTIDTRDAQKRIDEILPFKIEVNDTGDYDEEFATSEEAEQYLNEVDPERRSPLTITEYEDESEELRNLLELKDQVDHGEWQSGATLIADRYFADYAREYAEDIHGSAVRDAAWPFTHIDWDEAADDLRQDYTSVDYGGETYWVR